MKTDELAIKTFRVLSMEQITKAKSGHPGIALDAAPMIHALYSKILKVNIKDPKWINRDRFVLASGHGSALLYSVLHVAGFGLKIDDLKTFRQLGSHAAGHPEVFLDGVDATSGPLGQGIPEGIGMAIAEEYLAKKFNKENLKLIDHYTYVLCGDGDLQEGVTQEAVSLAGHLQLGKLIVLYDSNDIQLDGKVTLANTENVKNKFESMNWDYLIVNDGENLGEIYARIQDAKKSMKPTIIEVKTIIGHGSSIEGTNKVHGSPLSSEEVEKMRLDLGGNAFDVDEEVYDLYRNVAINNDAKYKNWQDIVTKYEKEYPSEYELFIDMITDKIKIDFSKDIMTYPLDYQKATRVSGGEVLNQLSALHKGIIGGSADLTSSTRAKGADGDFTALNRLGRNINFGVREHAMAAISNGIALHKGLRPFASGFFVFSDYMKPAIRLSSLMKLPVIYIFTHDTIAVGEDGPTHQPIEQLTMLRSIPGVNVIRPCDANEVREAYEVAINTTNRPTVIVLTRQDVPTLREANNVNQVSKGAYIISKEKTKIDRILIATESEVKIALDVQRILLEKGIDVRVISMPSINLFEEQSKEYKDEVIPWYVMQKDAIEMGEASHLYKYTRPYGKVFNINEFGKSGKYQEVMKDLGFDPELIAEEILKQ